MHILIEITRRGLQMVQLGSIRGIIRNIQDVDESGCIKQVVIDVDHGVVNLMINSRTYVLDQAMLSVGEQVVGFYDLNAPTPAIYPPRYEAAVVVKVRSQENVYIGYFNRQLISSDNQLQLNISRTTRITTTNGQYFTKNVANRSLIVIYSATTKSIPAQTTPNRIIVQC